MLSIFCMASGFPCLLPCPVSAHVRVCRRCLLMLLADVLPCPPMSAGVYGATSHISGLRESREWAWSHHRRHRMSWSASSTTLIIIGIIDHHGRHAGRTYRDLWISTRCSKRLENDAYRRCQALVRLTLTSDMTWLDLTWPDLTWLLTDPEWPPLTRVDRVWHPLTLPRHPPYYAPDGEYPPQWPRHCTQVRVSVRHSQESASDIVMSHPVNPSGAVHVSPWPVSTRPLSLCVNFRHVSVLSSESGWPWLLAGSGCMAVNRVTRARSNPTFEPPEK